MFRSWGRVGTTIGGNKLDKFHDKNSAMDNFLSVYKEKTGNNWGSANFTKYPNKFYPLEIDYGQVYFVLTYTHNLHRSVWCTHSVCFGYIFIHTCWDFVVLYFALQDEEAVKRLTASAGTKSKLAKPVQELIKMIFDVESMKKAMVEFEVRHLEYIGVCVFKRENTLRRCSYVMFCMLFCFFAFFPYLTCLPTDNSNESNSWNSIKLSHCVHYFSILV